ncbi:MAG: hypothetical protein ACP5HC_02170 [Caldisericum sp.]
MTKKPNGSNGIDPKEVLQILEEIFKKLAKDGTIDLLVSYDPVNNSPADIFSEIKVVCFMRLKKYNPKRGPLRNYIAICVREAVTNLQKRGSRTGCLVRENGSLKISEEKYHLYKNKFSHLDIKSKRKVEYVNDLLSYLDEEDRYDFFERRKIEIDLPYNKSPEEILIEREEAKEYEKNTKPKRKNSNKFTSLVDQIFSCVGK